MGSGSKGAVQDYFGAEHGIKVPRSTNYETIYKRIISQLGKTEGQRAIARFAVKTSSMTLSKILKRASEGEYIKPSSSHPAVVRVLFYNTGKPRLAGELLLDVIRESLEPDGSSNAEEAVMPDASEES